MRLVLLCPGSLNRFQRRVFDSLFEGGDHEIAGAVVDCRPGRSGLAKLKRNWKLGRGGYVLVMAWNQRFRRREAGVDIAPLLAERGVPVAEARKPYSPETLGFVREKEPDALVLIGGFGIIRRKLLDVPKIGVLSYHHGDMREYRGQPPGLWEIYRGESEMGVTVQKLSAGLDEGAPIVERRFPIEYGESVASLQRRLFEGTADMMREAVDLAADPGFRAERLDAYGQVYTLPNLRQWLGLHARLLARRLRRASGRAPAASSPTSRKP